MKSIILIILILFSYLLAQCQTAEDSVKAAVNLLFTAMKKSDPLLLQSSFGDSAVLQTISMNTEGALFVRTESVKEFANSVSAAPIGSLDERINFNMIKIDGPLASVWTPYFFYYNGKFSHCGVNSFQLIRTAQGWKIQYIIDTRRKSGCL